LKSAIVNFVLISSLSVASGCGGGATGSGSGAGISGGSGLLILGGVVVTAVVFANSDHIAGANAALAPARSKRIRSVRAFAAANELDPGDYGAYGIIAFPSSPTMENQRRFEYFCRAFHGGIPSFRTSSANTRDQFVTVWPTITTKVSEQSNYLSDSLACSYAVGDYGTPQAREALQAAEAVGGALTKRGPYIIAWVPGSRAFRPQKQVLVADFSDIDSYNGAEVAFREWSRDIQSDPSTWGNGRWNVEQVRRKIRNFSDSVGGSFLKLVGVTS